MCLLEVSFLEETEETLRKSVIGKCSIRAGDFGSGEDFLISLQVHFSALGWQQICR